MMLDTCGRCLRPAPDLLGFLGEYHARIRRETALALALGEGNRPALTIVDACRDVERFFRHALPLHIRDEEESIRPRLLGRDATLDAALAVVTDQHDLHLEIIERACRATAALRVDPESRGPRRALLAIARPMEFVLEAHLRIEEETIFPAIRDRLSREEQENVHREIRARRAAEGFL
jgi:hemerythrin-like domain-containing protein